MLSRPGPGTREKERQREWVEERGREKERVENRIEEETYRYNDKVPIQFKVTGV